MKRIVLSLLTVLFVWGRPVHATATMPFLPPAGEHLFPATSAELMVMMGTDTLVSRCGGPTVVMSENPVGPMIETEIVALSLVCTGPIMVQLDPNRRSLGGVNQMGDSFFDVFVEISLPDMTMVTNCQNQPVHLQARIAHVPPLGSQFFSAGVVNLCRPNDLTTPVAQLLQVVHDVNGVPKPESMGEVSQVFSCFYECKKDPRSTNWLEVTTLMLANQSADVSITAQILFLNGNQRPLGRARTKLSPLDLDEINVCATLDRAFGQAQVPQAGLIEVVLEPTGGVYGWVKNVTGRLQRRVFDPFGLDQVVTGVAKTECRLVGPNVVTPEKINRIEAPEIVRVLIEGTGDVGE
jgi:hypothetical protein